MGIRVDDRAFRFDKCNLSSPRVPDTAFVCLRLRCSSEDKKMPTGTASEQRVGKCIMQKPKVKGALGASHNEVLQSRLCYALPVTSDQNWRPLVNCCNRSPKMQATPGSTFITATRFRGGKPSSNGAVIPFTTIMKDRLSAQFSSPRATNEIHWLPKHAGGCRWALHPG
jgi:hypothetical protein